MQCSDYFNSRPCGRGDKAHLRHFEIQLYFNSRPCGRGDGKLTGLGHQLAFISIHAPAGGATISRSRTGSSPIISIHAPAGGATCARAEMMNALGNFNSRPCGRGDEGCNAEDIKLYKFQFTPLREGRRRDGIQYRFRHLISIHAPAGGATVNGCKGSNLGKISIHAPAGGATYPQSCDSSHG